MKIRFDCTHIEELAEAAEILVNYFRDERIFLIYGDMGAGKTSFIKAIANELGVKDVTNSPTFGLVNEYQGKNSSIIYHFDLYRIINLEELLSAGFDEYIHTGNYCFIEWPALAETLVPKEFVRIDIAEVNGNRIIEMQKLFKVNA
jgi:tRNA threonylcarbamoyladenosine biosynthesis protein TsaE